MCLWEFNGCARAYNDKQKEIAQEKLVVSWRMAAFNGAAFAGKLKPLKHYLKNGIEPAKKARTAKTNISKEEFEDKLRRAKRKGAR